MKERKGYKWWLFNLVAPKAAKNIVDAFHKNVNESEYQQVVISPVGYFKVHISPTSDRPPIYEVFRTERETKAFLKGVQVISDIFETDVIPLDGDTHEKMDNFDLFSTHGIKSKKMH